MSGSARSASNLASAAIATLVIGSGVAFIVGRIFFFDYFRVPSGSMHPTIPEGSFIIVSKHGYGDYSAYGLPALRTASTRPIRRGDIAVFRPVEEPDTHYVSRVIGAPGDRVIYANRQLSINGVVIPLSITHRDDTYRYATEMMDGREVQLAFIPGRYSPNAEVTVPPDHFFMLGDSRDNARDSRFIGFVPRENVVGLHVKTISLSDP